MHSIESGFVIQTKLFFVHPKIILLDIVIKV